MAETWLVRCEDCGATVLAPAHVPRSEWNVAFKNFQEFLNTHSHHRKGDGLYFTVYPSNE